MTSTERLERPERLETTESLDRTGFDRADTPAVPRQPPPPDGPVGVGGPNPGGPSLGRRWLTLLIVVLLVGIPAGYLMISAEQSRASGRDKEGRAAATGLTDGWPPKVTRRIYDVPIPPYSADVAYYETNSWRYSRLYVQFITSQEGLDRFLYRAGTSRSALRDGRVTISAKDARTVRWDFAADASGGSNWAGMVHTQRDPLPKQDITVDLSNPEHPKVYVVSTVTP